MSERDMTGSVSSPNTATNRAAAAQRATRRDDSAAGAPHDSGPVSGPHGPRSEDPPSPPPEAGATAPAGAEPGEPAGAFGALLAAAGGLPGDCWQLTETELLTGLAALDQATAMIDAARLRLLAEADSRSTAANQGATSLTALLRARQRWRGRDASREVRLATHLPRLCPQAAAALAAGHISKEHAHVIVHVLRQIPPAVADADRQHATEQLLDAARRFDPTDTARIGQRLLAHLDPDGPLPEDVERRARARRDLSWHPTNDGGLRIHGRLDPEGAATLLAALDPLAAPQPASSEHGPDPRTPGQRRADALTDALRRLLDTASLPTDNGQAPHITVTVPLDDLTARTHGAGGTLDHTGPISASTTRHLACDAHIIPIVMNGPSQPLDVGRATRTIPVGMRRALIARDQHCAYPGCNRPPGWCHAHHIHHWASGGPTRLDNLVLLCGHHHRRTHHDNWHITINAHGKPQFTTRASAAN